MLQHCLECLQDIDARLRFMHPSKEFIIPPWLYSKPMWVSLRKEDDRRAIILSLNNLWCYVIETQFGENNSPYNDEKIKYLVSITRIYKLIISLCFTSFLWIVSNVKGKGVQMAGKREGGRREKSKKHFLKFIIHEREDRQKENLSCFLNLSLHEREDSLLLKNKLY